MNNLLVEQKVVITISDPWEMAELNHGVLHARIIKTEGHDLTRPILKIQFDQPITFGTIQADIFVAHFRHADSNLLQLQSGKAVAYSFSTRFIDGQLQASKATDLAFIGTLELCDFL